MTDRQMDGQLFSFTYIDAYRTIDAAPIALLMSCELQSYVLWLILPVASALHIDNHIM